MRGLLPYFIADLKELKLKSFLTSVKEDDTLCLEIRENYDHHNNTLSIDMDGKELQLNTDRVLKAAITEHELY